MSNSLALAQHWTSFIASRPEFPAGPQLLAQFEVGTIKSLCTCGCNSYEFQPSDDVNVPRLTSVDGHYDAVFELMFQTQDKQETVEFTLFVETSAYFENEPEPGTEESDHFEALVMPSEAYEAKHYPLVLPASLRK